MLVSKQQIPTLSDRDLGLIATAADDTYPDEIVLAVWEELAARGLVVDFIEQSPLLRETQTDDLLTVATFRTMCTPNLPRLVCWQVAYWHFSLTTTRFG